MLIDTPGAVQAYIVFPALAVVVREREIRKSSLQFLHLFLKGSDMSPPRKKRRRKLWTATDFKQLKTLAGRQPVARIARRLRRTEPAVRWQATQKGISLAMKRG
jgi:hypothetical protein